MQPEMPLSPTESRDTRRRLLRRTSSADSPPWLGPRRSPFSRRGITDSLFPSPSQMEWVLFTPRWQICPLCRSSGEAKWSLLPRATSVERGHRSLDAVQPKHQRHSWPGDTLLRASFGAADLVLFRFQSADIWPGCKSARDGDVQLWRRWADSPTEVLL